MKHSALSAVIAALLLLIGTELVAQERPRAREAGLVVGIFETGPLNAITSAVATKATRVEGRRHRIQPSLDNRAETLVWQRANFKNIV